MENVDFYLHERALASYFEKDWFDHVYLDRLKGRLPFDFPPFSPQELYSTYHQDLVAFLATNLKKHSIAPKNVFEIGSSLGRTFYEICKNIDSVKSACLLEPSQNLFGHFKRIFIEQPMGIKEFEMLKGNLGYKKIQMDTTPIQNACSKVELDCINKSYQECQCSSTQYQLVICSNVIDQCHEPLKLVQFIQDSTSIKGLVLLSCTYQWNDKYVGNAGVQISDICELFDSSWSILDQTNLSFSVRVYERYWMKFLSHVCLFQKNKP